MAMSEMGELRFALSLGWMSLRSVSFCAIEPLSVLPMYIYVILRLELFMLTFHPLALAKGVADSSVLF